MKKILKMLFVGACMCVLATSCKSTKQVTGDGGGTIVDKRAEMQLGDYAKYAEWNTLTTSGKVAIGGPKSMSSSMQLRMVKGKSISVSIRPLLGIEMAKVYISDDEIVILDRYHKVYVKEKASILTSGLPVDVSTLQDILLGRAHVLGKGTLAPTMSGDVTIETTDAGAVIKPVAQYRGFTYSYSYDADKHIVSLDVKPVEGNSVYSVHYGDIETTVAGEVSTHTTVDTKIKDKDVSLDIMLKNMTWNTKFDDKIEIPGNYSQSSGASILKALGGTVR